jgi:hypothetical protein
MTVTIIAAVVFTVLWSLQCYQAALIVLAIGAAAFGLKVLP